MCNKTTFVENDSTPVGGKYYAVAPAGSILPICRERVVSRKNDRYISEVSQLTQSRFPMMSVGLQETWLDVSERRSDLD